MRNYTNWKISKWKTPLCREEDWILDSLVFDSNGLVLAISTSDSTKQFKFEFKGECSFRVIDEGYRNDLWERIKDDENTDLGNTWIVDDTDFLEFLSMDCVFQTVANAYREYFIRAGDDIIEIVARIPPEISELERQ